MSRRAVLISNALGETTQPGKEEEEEEKEEERKKERERQFEQRFAIIRPLDRTCLEYLCQSHMAQVVLLDSTPAFITCGLFSGTRLMQYHKCWQYYAPIQSPSCSASCSSIATSLPIRPPNQLGSSSQSPRLSQRMDSPSSTLSDTTTNTATSHHIHPFPNPQPSNSDPRHWFTAPSKRPTARSWPVHMNAHAYLVPMVSTANLTLHTCHRFQDHQPRVSGTFCSTDANLECCETAVVNTYE